jgi:general secretion pathway protein N
MITPTFKMAIIQPPDGRSAPLRIKVGEAHESLPNWRLQSLDARGAVFLGPEGERRLELRVFNGVGGEAPTAMTKPDNARPEGQPAAPQGPATASGETPGPQGPAVVASPAPAAPAATTPNQSAATEQSQMEAIRKRIEARRAQLRQEALQQQQKPPVK